MSAKKKSYDRFKVILDETSIRQKTGNDSEVTKTLKNGSSSSPKLVIGSAKKIARREESTELKIPPGSAGIDNCKHVRDKIPNELKKSCLMNSPSSRNKNTKNETVKAAKELLSDLLDSPKKSAQKEPINKDVKCKPTAVNGKVLENGFTSATKKNTSYNSDRKLRDTDIENLLNDDDSSVDSCDGKGPSCKPSSGNSFVINTTNVDQCLGNPKSNTPLKKSIIINGTPNKNKVERLVFDEEDISLFSDLFEDAHNGTKDSSERVCSDSCDASENTNSSDSDSCICNSVVTSSENETLENRDLDDILHDDFSDYMDCSDSIGQWIVSKSPKTESLTPKKSPAINVTRVESKVRRSLTSQLGSPARDQRQCDTSLRLKLKRKATDSLSEEPSRKERKSNAPEVKLSPSHSFGLRCRQSLKLPKWRSSDEEDTVWSPNKESRRSSASVTPKSKVNDWLNHQTFSENLKLADAKSPCKPSTAAQKSETNNYSSDQILNSSKKSTKTNSLKSPSIKKCDEQIKSAEEIFNILSSPLKAERTLVGSAVKQNNDIQFNHVSSSCTCKNGSTTEENLGTPKKIKEQKIPMLCIKPCDSPVDRRKLKAKDKNCLSPSIKTTTCSSPSILKKRNGSVSSPVPSVKNVSSESKCSASKSNRKIADEESSSDEKLLITYVRKSEHKKDVSLLNVKNNFHSIKNSDTSEKSNLYELVLEEEQHKKLRKNKRNPRKSLKFSSEDAPKQIKGDLEKVGENGRHKKVQKEASALEEARLQLLVSSVPSHSLPCRDKEFSNIYSFLHCKIETKTGGCMYISGVPGTGKTATVHAVVKKLEEEASDDIIPDFKFVEINALRLTEPRQAYVRIWSSLTDQHLPSQQAQQALDKRFSSKVKTSTVLLVDELDYLCNRRQDVVYNILDWPTKQGSGVVVLTIANTMDLPERTLKGKVTSRMGLTRVTFQPYTHHQLQEIVLHRLSGNSSFHPDAVQLVARKVAAVSGDARRALEICRRATELVTDANMVTIQHVEQAVSQIFTGPRILAIKNCSLMAQLFLRAIRDETLRTGVDETNIGQVFSHLKNICALEGIEKPITGDVLRIATKLESQGLIIAEKGRPDLVRKLSLNVSPDDIHYALNC